MDELQYDGGLLTVWMCKSCKDTVRQNVKRIGTLQTHDADRAKFNTAIACISHVIVVRVNRGDAGVGISYDLAGRILETIAANRNFERSANDQCQILAVYNDLDVTYVT